MPEDEHALEVRAVVRTYLRWGYTMRSVPARSSRVSTSS